MCSRKANGDVVIDCEAGRRLGCKTYCCCLLVRLEENERVPSTDGLPPKSFVEKDPSGYCIHLDRETSRCRIWDQRPKVCRDYDCNSDILLQIVLRDGFNSLITLVTATPPPSYKPRIKIPSIESES